MYIYIYCIYILKDFFMHKSCIFKNVYAFAIKENIHNNRVNILIVLNSRKQLRLNLHSPSESYSAYC